MQLSFEEMLHVLLAECYAKRNILFVVFVIVSLSIIAVGANWPKRYTSTVMIHIDKTNILKPLMHGAAVTTNINDQASNAREIIYGEKIMMSVLDIAGWLVDEPSDIEQEIIKKKLRKNIKVEPIGKGKNLLKIEYKDNDPMRAFTTAKAIAALYIKEGENSKIAESEAAYDFIEKQVNEYLAKLTDVEDKLRDFRSDNPESRRGLEGEVSNRISKLHSGIENARLTLRETIIKRDSLKKQLSGEAAITISQSREGQYRSKIANLQTRLETLRLDFKETYPDITRVKYQINDFKKSMANEIKRREAAQKQANNTGKVYMDEAIVLSPLYQKLRSDMSVAQTEIATLKARMSELKSMLGTEYERAKKMHAGEAMLSQLTRDYDVNKEIYQDLLRRRENARVSRSLDKEQQGLTFKIQEPAKLPLIPTGIRFMHFALAGMVMAVGIPIAIIYIFIILDPRIRFSRVLVEGLKLPLLGELSVYVSSSEARKEKINNILLGLGLLIVFAIYTYVSWLKYTEQL